MFKNILLTVDLNHDASWQKALPQAVELAKASDGMLHVITIVPDYGSAMVEGFFPEDFEEKALKKAQGELDALVAAHVPAGVKIKQHLGFGNIYNQVLKAIEDTHCDLVVMASHAPDRVREFLVGSNADRIVRRSPVSVLVVRG